MLFAALMALDTERKHMCEGHTEVRNLRVIARTGAHTHGGPVCARRIADLGTALFNGATLSSAEDAVPRIASR